MYVPLLEGGSELANIPTDVSIMIMRRPERKEIGESHGFDSMATVESVYTVYPSAALPPRLYTI